MWVLHKVLWVAALLMRPSHSELRQRLSVKASSAGIGNDWQINVHHTLRSIKCTGCSMHIGAPVERTLAVQIHVMIAPNSPATAPLMAPAAEILLQVMQNANGGTALPTTTPMNRYTQPRDRPNFLQNHKHSSGSNSSGSTFSCVPTDHALQNKAIQELGFRQ